MKVIHSCWAKPYVNNRWGVNNQFKLNLFTYALSALYAKKMFGNVTLVCDSISAEYLSVIGYDEIKTSLNELDKLNERFWSYGKIKSISLFNEPVLHIDGDVMLVGNEVKKTICSNYDVVVQMKEVGEHFTGTYDYMLKPMSKAVEDFDFSLYNFVYNCGVLGFKNLEFKEKYCNSFFASIKNAQKNYEIIEKIDRKYEINVVLEQSLLTLMAQNENVHVKELLKISDMANIGLEGLANKVGYAHLWGKSKYTDYWIGRVQNRIYELDRTYYNAIVNQYKKVSNGLS